MSSDAATLVPPTTAAAPAGLGLKALLAASIGVIVSQVSMVSLMQGTGIGGWGFVVALGAAFALALCNAMAYAEMALMMPSAGSLSSYAEAAVGNFPAILLVFAGYVAPCLFGIPAELILLDEVLRKAVPMPVPHFTVPVALALLMVGLNILGTDVFAKVQTALSFLVLGLLITTGVVALLSSHPVTVTPGAAAALGWTAFGANTVTLGVVALAFWVFAGSEFVTPLVNEARNAKRDLPRAMIGGLVIILVAQLLFALGTVWFVPREQLASSPSAHLDYVVAVFGDKARWWFAAFALVASASLLNTVFAAVPRMLSGMAQNGQVFPIFKRMHPRWGTPVPAILFIGALPLLGLAWSQGDANAIVPLTIAASVAWLLAYVTAQVSLMVLRRRFPHVHRPYRMPGHPYTPLLAIASMGYVMLNSAPVPEMAPQIIQYTAVVLGLFAVVGAVWVKFVMKKGLFEPIPPAF